jgi:chemotaxis protein histidine kinase CheA
MSQPLSEYFAQEAGDFLDELDALLAAPGAPDATQLFRLARGVRGSAQIAGADGVARVAERLEGGARAFRDGTLPWNDELAERVGATARDLRALVAARKAGVGGDALADAAVARWEGTAVAARGGAVPAAQILEFVAREVGGVAAEVDAALARLGAAPDDREPLRAVLRRMRTVRGVTGVAELAPVQEVLIGIEDVASDAFARTAPLAGEAMELLAAARDALRAAGDLLGSGAAVEGMLELERFRDLRDHADGTDEDPDADVVPISRLFFGDAGPHIVSSPTAPVRDAEGDGIADDVAAFLRIEATGFLDRAEALIAETPQGAPRRRFARVARQLASLAGSVAELAGTYAASAIAAAANAASAALRVATSAEEARAAIRSLRAALPGGSGAAPEADAEDEVVPIESLLFAPDDALRAALAMREQALALAGPAAESVLDEVFGLVEQGLAGRA